jgi:cytochrome P450
MRLHVADRFSRGREAPNGGMTICGTFVPAGVTVSVWAHVVQHQKYVLGEDVNVFQSERWLEGEGKATRMTNAMLSFGNGKCACIGKHLARLEIAKFVPSLLRDFEGRECVACINRRKANIRQFSLVNLDRDWTLMSGPFCRPIELKVRLQARS